MSKVDVWMPLYVADFLADTLHLSNAEIGSYSLLIFAYWRRRAPLPDDDRTLSGTARVSLSEWSAMRSALAQFFQVEGGVWRHKRIDQELAKAIGLKEARIAGAKATNRARRSAERPAERALSDPLGAPPSPSPSPSPSTKHEREYAERPSLQEVQDEAQRIGLAPWKAEDWFNEMETCGWKDFQKRDVEKWRPMLTRVRTKWEADGRPMGPPAAPQKQNGGQSGQRPLSPMDIKTIIAAKEQEANAIKQRYSSETAIDTSWSNPGKRAEWLKIRGEIKALNNRLAKMA